MTSISSIAGYELKKLLGSTGPTETYQARGPRRSGARAVAFKLLRLERLPVDARDPAAAKFLAAGRRSLAATVGGMARVIEVSEDPAVPFVASELVPGIDLAYLVRLARKRNPGALGLEPSLAGTLAAQVARILTSAHESSPPLPHLGLRPSNVRVTPEAGVVVVDFGLGASLRSVGEQHIARWYFLAPELLGVDASAGFDGSAQAADLYSLGALLYFLLAGRPPVEADSPAQLLERSQEPLPALPSVPDELNRAIRALTNPEPWKRPASAREAAEMLSGGIASPQERHQHIATALRALGISSRPKKAAAAPQAAPITAGTSPSPPVAKPAPQSAVRRPGRQHHRPWRIVVAGVGLIGLAAGVWGGVAAIRAAARHIQTTKPSQPAASPERPAQIAMVEIPGASTPRPTTDTAAPLDRVYMPMPKRKLPRVPDHLNLDTIPSQADVWVDGVLRGKTPVDLLLGPGGHRVVVLKEGFYMKKAVYDTTEGEWVRLNLQPVGLPSAGGAFVNVSCHGVGHYPILVDDEETGRLCPTTTLPVAPGRRTIGVFVPIRRAVVTTEVDVPPGPKPLRVTLNE